MNPLNQGSSSSAPPPPPPVANDVVEKRKRGRPRKDNSQVTPNTDVDLVGQTVYGEVGRCIDGKGTGYILNVKVKDSKTKLNGVVFWKGKDPPVTPENDVAPHVNNQTGHPHESDLPPNDQPTTDDVTELEMSESAGAAKSPVIHQSKGVEEEAAPSTNQ